MTRFTLGHLWPGSTLLLIPIFAATSAQAELPQTELRKFDLAVPVREVGPRVVTPELPPLQPTWPEPIERPLRLVLKRSERRVFLYRGDEQVGSYPVAVGRSGWETPLGTWTVGNKQEDPSWIHPFTGELVPPGPDNPLGERWIGFWTNGRNQIGFHGTPNPGSVGQAVSHGCVRMFNEDIRELYELVEIGTPVMVIP